MKNRRSRRRRNRKRGRQTSSGCSKAATKTFKTLLGRREVKKLRKKINKQVRLKVCMMKGNHDYVRMPFKFHPK